MCRVWQFSIPLRRGIKITEDWGFPDKKKHGHYRIYGEDFMEERFTGLLNESNTCVVMSTDTVTGSQDFVFFVSKSSEVLAKIKTSFSDGEGNPPSKIIIDAYEKKPSTPYIDKIRTQLKEK